MIYDADTIQQAISDYQIGFFFVEKKDCPIHGGPLVRDTKHMVLVSEDVKCTLDYDRYDSISGAKFVAPWLLKGCLCELHSKYDNVPKAPKRG